MIPAAAVRPKCCRADCGYCLLETLDYVHGTGFVNRRLQIVTDYPILPRACVPQLASSLATAQREAVSTAMRTGGMFGLDAPDADLNDLFLPVRTSSGDNEEYRGMKHGEYLYRCGREPTSEETWVISVTKDEDAWSRCEGRLWIDLNSARVRTDGTDPAAEVGGVFFDLSPAPCIEELEQIRSAAIDASSQRSIGHSRDYGQSAQTIAFSEGVSSSHVACTLLWRLGPFAATSEGKATTVHMPHGMPSVNLLSDIVVRNGETLAIHAEPTSPSLAIGRWQIHVEAGGQLQLLGLSLVDAVGGAAMVVRGEVSATNASFSRCVAGPNLVMRYVEGLVPEGSDADSQWPVHGVYISSSGGVLFMLSNAAKFTARGCTFYENMALGSRLLNQGGVMYALGGHIVLSAGTVMRANVAVGGKLAARGGALCAVYALFDITDALFSGNEARGGGSDVTSYFAASHDAIRTTAIGEVAIVQSGVVRGGVMDVTNCRVSISSTVFEGNKASGATLRTAGGAIVVGDRSAVVLKSVFFGRNEAVGRGEVTFGGAIRVDFGGVLRMAGSTFESNAATGLANAFGGAIVTEGSVVLEGGVAFRSNVVSGGVRAGGGAIAVHSYTQVTPSSLNASGLPGPVFVNNKVRPP